MEEENKLNYPHWDVEETHVNKVAEIRNIFRQVLDPEIGMDIIQLGLIRNVTITDNKAKIEMILTTPYCPYAPMLMESARKKSRSGNWITDRNKIWKRSLEPNYDGG